MAVQVLINAVDVTTKYDIASLVIRNSGMQGIAVCDVKIIDKPAGASVSLEHVLRVLDGGVEVFEGKIKSRHRSAIPDPGPNPIKVYSVSAQDYTHLLTQDVIDATLLRTGSRTDKAEVEFLLNTYNTKGITVGSTVQNTGTISRDIDYSGMNLYEALEEASKWLGTAFYIDSNLAAHWFVSEANAAPWNLSSSPNNSTTFGYRDLDLNDDSLDLVNAVWVVGTDIAQWVTDAGSIALYGRIETTLRDPEITSSAEATAAGNGYLAAHAFPLEPITLKTFTPGLKAGMTIQLTNALWSISAVTYRIAEVVTRHNAGTPGLVYNVALDSRPLDLGDLLNATSRQVTAAGVSAGSMESGLIMIPIDYSVAGANMVKNSSFESGSAGSWAVGSQWTFGHDPAFPEEAFHRFKVARLTVAAANSGDLVTTDFIPIDRTDFWWVSFWSFLRARSAGNFKVSIREYNAAGSLLASTITAYTAAESLWTRRKWRFGPNDQVPGTVIWNATTTQIKIAFFCDGTATGTWDVDGVQVERGSLITAYAPSPQELVDLQITATQIADDAVTTPKLIANAVVAGKIATDAVTASKIAAGSVTAEKLRIGGGRFLTNPDFESGTTEGWTFSTVDSGSLVTGNDPNWRSQGAWYAVIQAGPSAWAEAWQMCNGFRYGDYIQLSALMANAQARLAVEWFNNAGVAISTEISDPLSTGGGYNTTGPGRQTWVFGPAPANTAAARIVIANNHVSGALLFDDVWLSRVGDLITPDGNVTIDSTGIVIRNGRLALEDEYGQSVMVASGFEGAWSDFVRTGLYNGGFDANASANPASLGRTAHAPYWTLAVIGGSPVFSCSPGSLGWTLPASGASAEIKSDRVRVSETQKYQVILMERNNNFNINSAQRTIYLDFYQDAVGGSPATITLTSPETINASSLWGIGQSEYFRAGSGYKYVEVRIRAAWDSVTSGAPNYQLSDVSLVASPVDPYDITSNPGTVALTTTDQSILTALAGKPGGRYLIIWNAYFVVTTAGVGNCTAGVYVDGVAQGGLAVFSPSAATSSATVGQAAIVQVTGLGVLEIRARKSINAGVASINATHTTMVVIPIGS